MTLVSENLTATDVRESHDSLLVPALTSLGPSRSQLIGIPASQPRQNKSWRVAGLSAATLAIVVVALFQPWKALRSESVATESKPVAASEKVVKVERPQQAASANVVLPATIRPWQTAGLHARVSGYLAGWYKDLGSPVKAGELLAVIETPELDQELAEGTALAGEALAATVQAKAERREAEADLSVAEAQLTRARAEADLAVSQLARRKQILASQVITQEEFDTFHKQVIARQADVAAAISDVNRRRTNLSTRDAIIEVREATTKSRQANVERLKELQVFKRIVAPFDGTVTSRTAEVGMLVTAGKESLFTVEDMSRVRVQVNVPQAYTMQTFPGAAAIVSVPESAASSAKATVTRIAQSVDSRNRTMLAEIELKNDEHRFQPGSYVQVTLMTSQDQGGWTIPTNTLQMRVEGPHVAMVNERNQVEFKPVRLGRDLGHRVVVAEGIGGRERLIVNPGEELRNGEQVRVTNPTQESPKLAHHGTDQRAHE
ncbi:MAG: efflux RND transporter periplasmic adaptor subunit [Planctomycetes bacterium]|nr:efflux RND transporter periplasmic adaptor subunit [Planctomycetota bacterium]